MKKTLLAVLLCAIPGTSFGDDSKYAGIVAGSIILGTTIIGMPLCLYLASKKSETPDKANNTNWLPYAKIGAGLGFSALSAYLGLKANPNPPVSFSADNNTGVLCPNFFVVSNAAPWASLIPAYFFMRSGFEDLRLEKKALLKYQKKNE